MVSDKISKLCDSSFLYLAGLEGLLNEFLLAHLTMHAYTHTHIYTYTYNIQTYHDWPPFIVEDLLQLRTWVAS